jgi:demethylmenaquinone methyltransferase/2-methoxy-6-polyprenyl-1,4-benzoquinol methylase
MCRVMRPGGKVVIIEFSKPTKFPFRQAYNFYFKRILPGIGRIISKDRSAYQYLPESVMAFPDGERFIAILEKAGYRELQCIPLTFGISCIYTGSK